jgi:hypothetical protein
MTPFRTVLEELITAFTSDTRDDGTVLYKFRDDAPSWCNPELMQGIHAAVDDRFPDDWVYETAAHVADNLTGYDVEDGDAARDILHEVVDGLVDVYNADRLRWLASQLNNALLCDEAAEEFGHKGDMFEQIAQGQALAIDRIANAVIQAIETEAGNRDEEDDEQD